MARMPYLMHKRSTTLIPALQHLLLRQLLQQMQRHPQRLRHIAQRPAQHPVFRTVVQQAQRIHPHTPRRL